MTFYIVFPLVLIYFPVIFHAPKHFGAEFKGLRVCLGLVCTKG
jgi:hypothetical protein